MSRLHIWTDVKRSARLIHSVLVTSLFTFERWRSNYARARLETNIPSFTDVTSFQTRINFFNGTHTIFEHPLRTSWTKITKKQHKGTITINPFHMTRMSLCSQTNGVGLLGLVNHSEILMFIKRTIQLINKKFIWVGSFQWFLQWILLLLFLHLFCTDSVCIFYFFTFHLLLLFPLNLYGFTASNNML